MNRIPALVACFILIFPVAFGASKPDPVHALERLICVVPITGKGTYEDPKRPLFAPTLTGSGPDSIVAYSFEVSDDGKYALVEFVARSKKAFNAVISDSRTEKAFSQGKDKPEIVEAELKKYKKNFKLDSFAGRAR